LGGGLHARCGPIERRVTSDGDPFFFGMSANNGKIKQTKAQRLRERLKGRPDDDFKVAMIQAIQRLEGTPHPNLEEALSMVGMAITLHDRKDGVCSRLALYLSGVFVSPQAASHLWAAISSTAQTAQLAPKN
jgi:hypothetical protein